MFFSNRIEFLAAYRPVLNFYLVPVIVSFCCKGFGVIYNKILK